jgi:hypothetical protein
MNFNDLPCDIKKIIFNKNREEQIKIEKEKFNIVIDIIKDVGERIKDDFFEDELRTKYIVFIYKFHQSWYTRTTTGSLRQTTGSL